MHVLRPRPFGFGRLRALHLLAGHPWALIIVVVVVVLLIVVSRRRR
ncbi:MAG: hypothetical protein FWE71_10250 [Nocardioidaceae bacterium]|nr:hypothetical protein [Nocardioidaceae bacterium]MCL2614239.1 hypothetical protein [Nocardioidaceae bacterium]